MFERLRKNNDRRKARKVAGSLDEAGLVRAVRISALFAIEVLLTEGLSPNIKTEDGQPLLSLAIETASLPIVRVLLQAGANVNETDAKGHSSLMVAIESGNRHLVNLLLDAGPNLELADLHGETALMKAVLSGNTAMVTDLIHVDAEVDARDEEGKTALFLAVENMRVAMTRALLAAGADPNHRDQEGRTPLSIEYLNPRIEKLLKEAGGLKTRRHSSSNGRDEGGKADLLDLLPLPLSKVRESLTAVVESALDSLELDPSLGGVEERGRQVLARIQGSATGSPPSLQDELVWISEIFGELKTIAGQLAQIATMAPPEKLLSLGKLQRDIHEGLQQFSDFLSTRLLENGQTKADQSTLNAALRDASAQGARQAVRTLILLGADVNDPDALGRLSLDLAEGHPLVQEVLIKAGAATGRGEEIEREGQ